jgi:MoaA/NifB/PqqE/SkfB family radical SAM enzyme
VAFEISLAPVSDSRALGHTGADFNIAYREESKTIEGVLPVSQTDSWAPRREQANPQGAWNTYLDDDAFWTTLRRRILPLRPSQYDVTARCNLTCEGCLFFSGTDYFGREETTDISALEYFYAAEAARGIRFGYFAGAEPSLVESKLLIAARHIPYGTVFTNGTRRLSQSIPYRVHISVWGKPEQSRALRGASMLAKQVRNYRGDRRAVFVFTITAQNVGDINWVANFCADNDLALTFNHYSPTAKYISFLVGDVGGDQYHARSADGADLILQDHHLRYANDTISRLLDEGHGRILYTHKFNDIIHNPAGLYPGVEPGDVAADCGSRLVGSLRHHNTDLTSSSEKCCSPNVSCSSCRLYAQSYATLLIRATRTLRRSHGRERSLDLWRLWCALFLNDDQLSAWRSKPSA